MIKNATLYIVKFQLETTNLKDVGSCSTSEVKN